MRTLYVMRHADSPMSFDMNDKERPLSAHGMEQAKSVAPHLNDIQHVLCSSAMRTKMTCEVLIEAGTQVGKVDYLDELYNAPMGVLLDVIQRAEAENILLIAHNPGIHALANFLAIDDGSSEVEKLKLFYNPATVSVFDCDIENWANIQPNANKLTDLIIPPL